MAARGTNDSLKSKSARGAKASASPKLASSNPALEFGGILAIADSLPVMVAYLDRDHIYRFVNKPVAEWFERPRSQMLGRTMSDVLGKENYAARKDAVEAALKGERQWFAASFDHPTRGPLTTQAEYVPHVLPDGSVAGIVMVIQDVTEQRAAELALRESEQRFRRIADS